MVKRLLGLSTLLLFAAGAEAGVVISLESKAPSGSGFNWVYDVTLERNSLMSQNDFFVIYDIPGLSNPLWAPNTSDANGNTGVPDINSWAVSQPPVGPVPPFLNPNDNPATPNVEVQLISNDTIAPRDPLTDPNGLLLGKLTVTSPFSTEGIIDYTSQGSALNVVASVPGPIPEPSTVGMMGAGLVAVSLFALRRRRH